MGEFGNENKKRVLNEMGEFGNEKKKFKQSPRSLNGWVLKLALFFELEL